MALSLSSVIFLWRFVVAAGVRHSHMPDSRHTTKQPRSVFFIPPCRIKSSWVGAKMPAALFSLADTPPNIPTSTSFFLDDPTAIWRSDWPRRGSFPSRVDQGCCSFPPLRPVTPPSGCAAGLMIKPAQTSPERLGGGLEPGGV